MANFDLATNLSTILYNLLGAIAVVIVPVVMIVKHDARITALEDKNQDADKKDTKLWEKIDSIQTTLNQLFQSIGELKGRIDK